MPRHLPLAPVLALLAAGACAHAPESPKFRPVADADFGRLAPDQMGPVEAGRDQLFAAEDAVARARLRVEQAKHEVELARADQTAAQAAVERARAELEVAGSSNAAASKARAQEAAAQAELRRRSAQAHLAYTQRLVTARQAEEKAAQEQVKVRRAALERAKLTALSQAGIPAAAKYNPAPFDAHLADAERDFQRARASASEAFLEANQVYEAWSALHQQYLARVEEAAGRVGTGAGADTGNSAQPPSPAPQPSEVTSASPPSMPPLSAPPAPSAPPSEPPSPGAPRAGY